MAKVSYVTYYYKAFVLDPFGGEEKEIIRTERREENNFKISDVVKDGGFWLDEEETEWIPYSAIRKVVIDEKEVSNKK